MPAKLASIVTVLTLVGCAEELPPESRVVLEIAGRPVTVGEWSGADWIISSGLAAGDKVIVEGIAKIFFPGQPVQVGPPQGGPVTPAPGKGTPGQAPAGAPSPEKK